MFAYSPGVLEGQGCQVHRQALFRLFVPAYNNINVSRERNWSSLGLQLTRSNLDYQLSAWARKCLPRLVPRPHPLTLPFPPPPTWTSESTHSLTYLWSGRPISSILSIWTLIRTVTNQTIVCCNKWRYRVEIFHCVFRSNYRIPSGFH